MAKRLMKVSTNQVLEAASNRPDQHTEATNKLDTQKIRRPDACGSQRTANRNSFTGGTTERGTLKEDRTLRRLFGFAVVVLPLCHTQFGAAD